MLLWLKFLLTWNIGKLKPKNGGPLPEPPHSEDPTQWLFQGNVKDSEAPRYMWPWLGCWATAGQSNPPSPTL